MFRIGQEEIDEITKVIESKQLFRTGDPKAGHLAEVESFEAAWAEKIGSKYALLMAGGGTSALICALVGLGIGPGDEVIIPAYTFMATAVAVLAVGAIPVPVDIDSSMAIDPDEVEKTIGPNTRAIIPVHMVGIPADMERICAIAKKQNLFVVEDACQAVGGSYKGKRLGHWGDVGAFSFNYFKIITCGDGGAMVTDDPKVHERAMIYHDSGIAFRPIAGMLTEPVFAGLQLRANEVMGAMMNVQLQRLDGILTDLRRNKKRFISELTGKPGVKFAKTNDLDGDCGVAVPFQFDTEEQARQFEKAPGFGGWLPIDTGRHIYCYWEPVLEKRAGVHPALNPYNLPQNQGLRMDYNKDSFPRTMHLVRTTVMVSMSPEWSEAEVSTAIAACEKAAAEVR